MTTTPAAASGMPYPNLFLVQFGALTAVFTIGFAD
jgi:hypothetical protein